MDLPMYSFVSLFIGLLVGAGVVWLILLARISAAELRVKSESQVEIATLNERLNASQAERADRVPKLVANLEAANQEISTLKQSIADIREKVGRVNSTIESQA